jgi:uncharacterized membrane protein
VFSLLKLFTFLHRWFGVVLGLFFAMWFFTGMVMIYVPFPSLSEGDRLSYLETVDTAEIVLPPAEAIAVCGPEKTTGLRVISIQGRPAYVCNRENSRMHGVYADTGAPVQPLEEDAVTNRLQRFTSAPIDFITKVEYDQWIVHQRFDALRPFYRIELQDVLGTQLYVSSRTGEFVQRTTSSLRFWNYLGAVAHWIYPTMLRKHWAIWDSVVWWLSGLGVVCVILGIYLGVSHLVELRRAGKAGLSSFRGWMKWHHVLGLFTGLIILSWIVSGWLSMDHGRLFSMPEPTVDQVRAIQGAPFGEVVAGVSVERLQQYQAARELTIHAFDRKARIVAKNSHGLLEAPSLEPTYVADVVNAAFPEAGIDRYSIVPDRDTYTHLREGSLPPGTIRLELTDSNQSWVHVDHQSGEVLSILDNSRRVYRWLNNGLHSLDFPGLVDKRPMWDAVMLILLFVGFVTSSTGVVIGLKRATRTFF